MSGGKKKAKREPSVPAAEITVALGRIIGEGAAASDTLVFRAPTIEDEIADGAPAALAIAPDAFKLLVAEAERAEKVKQDIADGAAVRIEIPDLAEMRKAVDLKDAYEWAKILYRGDPAILSELSGIEVVNIGIEMAMAFFMGLGGQSTKNT